nr:uncharacterized protein LOC120973420 [Aegilops tauschii subsp. strangulata]
MSTASGFVAVPRCPVIFDGTNYTEFAGFMRIHMRGIRLWGVLSGEVCCPPRPVPPVAPTPPTPLVLPPDANQAAKDAAKVADEAADRAYDERALAYEEALQTYHGALSVYTQWLDDDARAAAVLTASVLPQFASEFLGLPTVFQMWTCLRQRYEPSGDALYLSVVRQEHALQQGDSTVDDFYAQSSAIWRQLDSLRSAGCRTCPAARLSRPIWSFIASTSSCLGSVRSLSPGVLSCLLVAVFLSWRRFRRFVLRRLAYAVLVCWRFPRCSLLRFLPLHLLHRLILARVLRRSCPLLLAAPVGPVHIVTTATMMVILSPSATQSGNTCARRDHPPQGLRHLPRQLQPLL